MDSLWVKTTERPQFESLEEDVKTDVLIIGGGITGILCAYMLDKAGVNYILVEADRICGGITKDTTAKITFQHGLIYDKLIRSFGIEGAKTYLEANRNALVKYSELCRNIDCGFEEKDSFVYSLSDKRKIEAEVAAMNQIGACARFISDLSLPFPAAGAVKVEKQAQFHPLKFAYSIVKDLRIYENTKVLEMKYGEVITNRAKIKPERIIVATHFPFLNKHGSYFLKLYQHRSYVLALKNAPKVDGMYVDESKTGMSFRSYDDFLLIGGGDHRTGKRGGNWRELSDFARRNYPKAKEVYRWATQDCMSLDGIPYIGQYSKRTPDLYVATGFNKWGMSSAMVAATILSDVVQGKENQYAWLFSPSRSILTSQLAVNIAESAIGLLTPTVPRCPHLGCALKYNPQEHSWDCPCHGSRFTDDGKLINNPATDDRKRNRFEQ